MITVSWIQTNNRGEGRTPDDAQQISTPPCGSTIQRESFEPGKRQDQCFIWTGSFFKHILLLRLMCTVILSWSEAL